MRIISQKKIKKITHFSGKPPKHTNKSKAFLMNKKGITRKNIYGDKKIITHGIKIYPILKKTLIYI